MADEGDLPKVDGDIYYASEVNRSNPKIIGFNSLNSSRAAGSATAYTTISTIAYPGAGSLQILDSMIISTQLSTRIDATGNSIGRFRISGAGLNMVFASKTIAEPTTGQTVVSWNHLLTSGAITASGGDIGSPYDISFEVGQNFSIGDVSAFITDYSILGY